MAVSAPADSATPAMRRFLCAQFAICRGRRASDCRGLLSAGWHVLSATSSCEESTTAGHASIIRQRRVMLSSAPFEFDCQRCWPGPGESCPKKVWFPQKLSHYPKAPPKQAMHSECAAPELPQCPRPSRPGLGGGGARESMCLLTACRAELSRAGLALGIGGALR